MTRESNYTADGAIRSKFGNSSFSMRNVWFNFITISPEKSFFFMRGDLGSSSIIWD